MQFTISISFFFFQNYFCLCFGGSFIFYNAKSFCKSHNKIRHFQCEVTLRFLNYTLKHCTQVAASVMEPTQAISSKIKPLGVVKGMNVAGRKSVLGEFKICVLGKTTYIIIFEQYVAGWDGKNTKYNLYIQNTLSFNGLL